MARQQQSSSVLRDGRLVVVVCGKTWRKTVDGLEFHTRADTSTMCQKTECSNEVAGMLDLSEQMAERWTCCACCPMGCTIKASPSKLTVNIGLKIKNSLGKLAFCHF